MTTTLTADQAYAAMYYFLDQFYSRSGITDLGSLLGDMSLLPDGQPADSAVVEDWQEAVQFALRGGKAGNLVLRK